MDLENQNDVQGNGAANVRNQIFIADDRDRAIRQIPEVEAPHFELKPMMFQMLQMVDQFSEMPTEDPHLHLRLFMEAYIAKNDVLIQGQATTLENLKNQVVQLANELRSKLQGVVPSNIENPLLAESSNNLENLLKACMTKNDATLRNLENQMGQQLGIGKARPTTVTVQHRDRSLAYLRGKIEDVLVHVDKFIFPVDFIILDFEADKKVQIILGRPFLAIDKTIIDVQKGELTVPVQDEQVTFNVINAIRSFDEVKDCSTVSKEDPLVPENLEYSDPLEGISFDFPHQDADDTCLEAK
ncbi:uncharacterized protein LOC105781392 [Gossypium raimondii]|uniref:uncharacterized protein LOC105781392 n=1 Tax=Gossypium raimondii TaxID=29730 RepID=UPI00063AA9B0|nr:uncharacterized protein LOC105781392 [Gossypium raimondii]